MIGYEEVLAMIGDEDLAARHPDRHFQALARLRKLGA